jgi:hypothetical protein
VGTGFDDYPLLPNSLAGVPSGCVLEDVKRIYGEEPTEVVTIGIDSNDTKARAESYMGRSCSASREGSAGQGIQGQSGQAPIQGAACAVDGGARRAGSHYAE